MTVKLDEDGGSSIEKASLSDYLNRLKLTNEVFGTDFDFKGKTDISDELDDSRIVATPVVTQKSFTLSLMPHQKTRSIKEYIGRPGI